MNKIINDCLWGLIKYAMLTKKIEEIILLKGDKYSLIYIPHLYLKHNIRHIPV